MKLSEALRFINNTFNSNELEALASSGTIQGLDIEVSDDFKEEFNKKINSFLTLESAKNNPELEKFYSDKLFDKVKGKALGNIDTASKAIFLDFIGEERLSEFDEIENSKEKLRFIHDELKKVMEGKSDDEKTKKVIEGYKNQIKAMQTEYDKKLELSQGELEKHRAETESRILNKEFRDYVNKNYVFADAYQKDEIIKDALIKRGLEKANSEAILKLDENDNIVLRQKDNPDMEYFVGTKKGDLKDLLNPAFEPYTKKADPPKPKESTYQYKRPNGEVKISPMLAGRLPEERIERANGSE